MPILTDAEFLELANYLKDNFGINLLKKRTLVDGRLSNYLNSRGIKTYREYIDLVKADRTGKELEQLLNRVTTNHTYFMREPEHFDYFRDAALPALEGTVRDKSLRIWSAACSSGEEPYTLQMIMHDYFGAKKPQWDTRLLATDISERALSKARLGIYASEAIQNVPALWRQKYFTKLDDRNVQISQDVRNDLLFRSFNLMDDFPWKQPFHIIFCRNVMIYFDLETKTRLINKFYDSLVPGGYLFVGLTEAIHRGSTRFHYVQPSLYRK